MLICDEPLCFLNRRSFQVETTARLRACITCAQSHSSLNFSNFVASCSSLNGINLNKQTGHSGDGFHFPLAFNEGGSLIALAPVSGAVLYGC